VDVVGGPFQAVGDQQPGEALGVVLVHLAAKGANDEGFGAVHPRSLQNLF
jgi:hypothetical protein